ncbi:transcriptional activator protein FnrL [Oceaniovalibus guishaninsula JLT2003]|uniref:Transcriptional activator protein FnrL n=1 Tax=Oceaniovalibus guishaninsula JLT2003 TaxID=1231392 RepID=K2HK51_9RHOB|nr:Crp/Fnr family transcriptional regulator [Oceaniovalibus guishaninsula]EKE43349.1 transcriptional activator protein FnrL [Oceaniovalibus guishaninsula JLT2003]
MELAPLATRQCQDCPIRTRAVCSRCSDDELVALEEIKFYRTYPAGSTIVWAGDAMPFVASVVSGCASLTRSMADGRTQMVGLLLQSDFLGDPSRTEARFDVTAVSNVLLCHFDRERFARLTETNAHVRGRLLEMTLDELDAAREWMLLLGRKTAQEKVASLLVIFARRLGQQTPDGLQFDLPLTREAMANYLGLTLETVSRQVAVLRKTGAIRTQGARHMLVPDLDALLGASGDDDDGDVLA